VYQPLKAPFGELEAGAYIYLKPYSLIESKLVVVVRESPELLNKLYFIS
jgi:hypothetical protein